MRLIGSPGQPNDIAFAHDLVQGFEAEATTADKGYDADHFHETIAETGAQIVISPKRNRKIQSPYDRDLYKERNLIERFFAKLKQFRRVATRYDKVLINFMGFVKLAAMAIWLKQLKVTTPKGTRRWKKQLPTPTLRTRRRQALRLAARSWWSSRVYPMPL